MDYTKVRSDLLLLNKTYDDLLAVINSADLPLKIDKTALSKVLHGKSKYSAENTLKIQMLVVDAIRKWKGK